MKERLACALNGADFNSLDPRLYLDGLEEEAQENVDTAALCGGGRRIIGRPGRRELTVTLRFMIKERDPAMRGRILDRVNAWAAEPGWLTLSTRPGQRLRVICTRYAERSALPWSGAGRIALTAYQRPYWQERYPVSTAFSGTEGSAALVPAGSRACCLEAEITNRSAGAVNAVSISAGGKTMAFSGLGLAAGQTLRLYYDDERILHAESGGVPRLACRTPESADGLPLVPGRVNQIRGAADGACRFNFIARGEWQ